MIREAIESKEQDKITRDRIDAKNSLENYIYSMKNKIEDKEKVIGVKLTEDEKKTIGNVLKEAQDWINSIQEAEKEEYETHLKDLQKICDPIIGKFYQLVWIQPFSGQSQDGKNEKPENTGI